MNAFLARAQRCALPGVFLLIVMLGCRPTVAPPGPDKPQRIASLTLATDEILEGLQVPVERIVSVTTLVDDKVSNVAGHYPPTVKRMAGVDVEHLLTLEPDLILVAPYTNADALELLQRSGKPVFRYDATNSMDDIAAAILALGERLGEPEKAKALTDRFQTRRKELARKLQNVKHKPRVLSWSGGFTAGSGTSINDLIVEAGGVNVAAELGLKGHSDLSPERVIVANPEIILIGGDGDGDGEGDKSGIFVHPILRKLPAVREGGVVRLEGRYLSTLSHHLIEGAERLARKLHPECVVNEKQP